MSHVFRLTLAAAFAQTTIALKETISAIVGQRCAQNTNVKKSFELDGLLVLHVETLHVETF